MGKEDPDPWIHLFVIVDPDSFGKSGSGSGFKVDPDPSTFFHIFHKEIHVGQIKMLIFITDKI